MDVGLLRPITNEMVMEAISSADGVGAIGPPTLDSKQELIRLNMWREQRQSALLLHTAEHAQGKLFDTTDMFGGGGFGLPLAGFCEPGWRSKTTSRWKSCCCDANSPAMCCIISACFRCAASSICVRRSFACKICCVVCALISCHTRDASAAPTTPADAGSADARSPWAAPLSSRSMTAGVGACVAGAGSIGCVRS